MRSSAGSPSSHVWNSEAKRTVQLTPGLYSTLHTDQAGHGLSAGRLSGLFKFVDRDLERDRCPRRMRERETPASRCMTLPDSGQIGTKAQTWTFRPQEHLPLCGHFAESKRMPCDTTLGHRSTFSHSPNKTPHAFFFPARDRIRFTVFSGTHKTTGRSPSQLTGKYPFSNALWIDSIIGIWGKPKPRRNK